MRKQPMERLPPELICHIYSFDSTYYDAFLKVMHQFCFRRIWWNHFYSPRPWICAVLNQLTERKENRWLFRGEEFYWEMYTAQEYETYVRWRCFLHRSFSFSLLHNLKAEVIHLIPPPV